MAGPNPPLFLRKARARYLLRTMAEGSYFKSIESTINDIVKWEHILNNSTSEQLSKYDDDASPGIVLAALRVIAVTETMLAFDMSATAAGVVLDTKLQTAYEQTQASYKRDQAHAEAYAHVRSILNECGPKDE